MGSAAHGASFTGRVITQSAPPHKGVWYRILAVFIFFNFYYYYYYSFFGGQVVYDLCFF
jgi:hypothetical protein